MPRSLIVQAVAALTMLVSGMLAAQELPAKVGPVRHPATATSAVGASQGRTPVLERLVTLDLQNVPLNEALKEINRQAELGLAYTARVVPVDRRVTVRGRDITAGVALERVLQGTGVRVMVTEVGTVVLTRAESSAGNATADAQDGRVWGLVTDSLTGEPVANVLVSVRGIEAHTFTNDRGFYNLLRVPVGARVITARLVGYTPMESEATVSEDVDVRIDFMLRHGITRLQQVVTTASGRQRRLEIPNSITVIDADSIVRTMPITSITDLLATRVAGLVVLPTTGAPGDPSRLRLRGSSSIRGSNDPIVIVDGVRSYAEQSAPRSASLATTFPGTGTALPAPSPLDRIDPNSIETIEVVNGPSAAALYGADAANGVIIITTKKGRPGPARWDVSITQGRSYIPGRFPDTYIGFGRILGGPSQAGTCGVLPSASRPATCVVDSVVTYQLLNDPELSVFGRGHSSSASLTVSGGLPGIRYSVTGSYSDELGLLKLPRYESDRYRERFGRAPEHWMERPHQFTTWALASNLGFEPRQAMQVDLTMNLTGVEQQRSSLEEQLAALRGAYVDKVNGVIYRRRQGGDYGQSQNLAGDFYQRTVNRGLKLRTGVNVMWQPFARLIARADAGVDVDVRRDEALLPRGLRGAIDSLGFLSTGHGNVRMGALNARAAYDVPLRWGFEFVAATGFNYTVQSIADVKRSVPDPTGAQSTAPTHQSSQFGDDVASYGWYIAPRLGNQRIFLDLGLRLDGGSNYGGKVSGFGGLKLPKLGFSWLVSEEPLFPFKGSRFLSSLRVRAAYGRAGVQPNVTDLGRTFTRRTGDFDGQTVDIARLGGLGNTRLRPERSTEIEGGVDASFLDDQLSIELTGYRKTKDDALLDVPIPISVNGGGNLLINIGVVRNTGFELTLGTNLRRSELVQWRTDLRLSHNRNVVVSLAEGVEAYGLGGTDRCGGEGDQCVVAGYPLFGYWERPILGYADVNRDGIIQHGEILFSDSAAFLGAPEPAYAASLHTTVGLFNQALSVSASFDYQNDLTQRQSNVMGGVLSRAMADPSAPLLHQAFVVAADPGSHLLGQSSYGLIQSVSALRFHSLAVNWRLPARLVSWLGVRHGTLGVQATNLGLITNYRGKDPLVNSVVAANGVSDRGALPRPRNWRIAFNFSY